MAWGLYQKTHYQVLARRANQRLRALERAGYNTAAYRLATFDTQDFNNSNRFSSRVRGRSDEDLQREYDSIVKFLGWKTSTVSGERKRRENIIKAFENKGLTIDNPQEFLDFLASEIGQDMMAFDSGQVPGQVADALRRGRTLDELIYIYNNRDDDESSLDIFDDWVEMDTYVFDEKNEDEE